MPKINDKSAVRLTLLIGFLLSSCNLFAAEVTQGQTANQNKESEAKQQQPSKPTPIVVNVVQPPKTEEEKKEEREERERNAIIDGNLVKFTGQLAKYTFGLFLATILLAVGTLGLVWVAYRQSRDTADLKEISSRQIASMENLERPWLFNYRVYVERREGAPIQPNLANNWYISFHWINVGRAPAVIDECICRIQDKDTLPDIPDYTNGTNLNVPNTVAKDVTFETSKIGPGQTRVKGGEPINFIVYGRLTYRELNGKVHQTGFAIEVSPHLPACNTYKKYEYYN